MKTTLRSHPFFSIAVIGLTAALAQLSGCGPDTSNGLCDSSTGMCRRDVIGDGRTDSRTDSPTDTRPPGPNPNDAISVVITPADHTIEALNGARPMIAYRANIIQRDGNMRGLAAGQARFSIDNTTIGEIDGSTGAFVGTGVGGVARVRVATLDGSMLTADTGLTVNVRRVLTGPGVTDVDRNRFGDSPVAADAATTGPVIDYPLAGAVMPRNVFPPKLQWTPRHATRAPNDVYRIRLVRPHAVVEGYFLNASGFNNAWQMTTAEFTGLANTDVGDPIQTIVSVVSGGFLRDSAPLSFRTIDGVIAGAVYYWSPPRGRLVRIDVDQGLRVDFLPNPRGGCIACHAITRDGRRMAAVIDHGSPITASLAGFDLTVPLTASPPPTTFSGPSGLWAESFNGDGTRMVISPHGGGALAIINGLTGAPVATTGTLGSGFDPEWSPNSAFIAFSSSNNLMLTPVHAGEMYGPPTLLHTATDSPNGTVDWHPSWSPDSNWLMYQHGAGPFTTANPSSQWLISRMGGPAIRLDHLNGGPTENDSFRAVFSPFNSGGYFWVLFTTGRPYGNTTAGVRSQKLIWVAAIRNRPDGTTDPSEVPYYLEGQEPITNLSPFWSPPPCRANGTGCLTGADCCSGTCEPDAMGNPMCRPPRGACRPRGGTCSDDGDCCMSPVRLVCNEAHLCDVPNPG